MSTLLRKPTPAPEVQPPVRGTGPRGTGARGAGGDDGNVRTSYAMDRTALGKVPTYWRHVTALGTSGTLLTAGGLSVQHNPHMLAGTLACTAVATTATGVTLRSDMRREISSALRASLERIVGPIRRWRCMRWNAGIVGTPRVIKLRYYPEGAVSVKNFPEPVIQAISQMLHATYVVDKNRPELGKLVLRRKDVTLDDIATDRGERIMAQLFGEDAHVGRKQDGSTEIITVTYSNVVKAADAGWRAATEHVVDTVLPGRWRARWDLLNDQVRFEVRPKLPTMLLRRPPKLDPSSPDFWRIPLGEDEDGNVASWNLNSSQPHLLSAGKTGKGKSNLILGVGQELSVRQIAVWGVDPKRIELQALRDLPNVQIVATRAEDMAAVVMCAYNEMERRYQLIEDRKARKGDFQRLVILIDEYSEFVMRIQSWWATIKVPGMPTKCPVMERFESLIRLCRAAQMNVMVGIQRPDVRFLPGEARANFDARVSLGPLEKDGSEMMWGSQMGTMTGLARGRAMACADDDTPREIQTYWTPDRENNDLDEETLALLDAFKTEAVHPPLRVSIPAPDQDDKGRELWWEAIQEARMVIDDTPRVEEIVENLAPMGKPSLHLVTPPSLDEDDTYGQPITCSLDKAFAGDLYLREEPDVWVQIQGLEPDPLETDKWALSWEAEDGTEGTDLIPDDNSIKVRHIN